MASKHKQRGFIEWLPAAATVASALIGSEGQEDTNESNQGINSAQMAFNAAEAEKARGFNAQQAQIARENNAWEAEKTRDFQTRQRATQYQQAIADLKAAGLNPMLSVMGGSGASSPVGALYTPDNPMKGYSANVQNALMNKSAIKKVDAETMTQLTQQNLNSAATQREVANANLSVKQLEAVNAAVQRDLSASAVNSATAKNLGYDAEAKRLEAEIYNTPYIGKGLRILEKVGPLGGKFLSKFFKGSPRYPGRSSGPIYVPERR